MNEKVAFPNKLNAKGKIKIEMFDEKTGVKVDEIEDTNFISKGMDTLYKIRMLGLFTNLRGTGSINPQNHISGPFNQLTLTSASHAEAPNSEWIISGSVVGTALSTGGYSGTDKLTGGYNLAESYTKTDQVRMVFDFPTHAGNGTFQSIYFGPETMSISNPLYFKKVFDEAQVRKVVKYKDRYYTLSSSNFKVYDLSYELIEEHTVFDYATGFDIFNDSIYYTGSGLNPSRGVNVAPISDPSNVTQIVKVPLDDTFSICYDKVNNWFLVAKRMTGSWTQGGIAIVRYDTDFNILSQGETSEVSFNSTSAAIVVHDEGVTIGTRSLNSDFSVGPPSLAGLVTGTDGINIFNGDGVKLPKVGFSSRSLLASPVTKTEQNTMKITYDFILPSFYE